MKPKYEIIDIACRYIKQRIGKDSPTDESCLILSLMERVLIAAEEVEKKTPLHSTALEVAYLLFFLSISVSTKKGLSRWGNMMSGVTMAETPPFKGEPKFFSEMRQYGSGLRDGYYDLVKRASAG